MLGHVASCLGKPALASVPISAVMLSRLETVDAEQSLEDAAHLFVGGRNEGVPVIEGGTTVGVVTRDDVAIGLERSGPSGRISEAPCHNVVTVSPSDSLAEVLARLYAASPETLAVVVDDDGIPVGVLTVQRLVAYVEGRSA
jgi:predicted transcriptional regulator